MDCRNKYPQLFDEVSLSEGGRGHWPVNYTGTQSSFKTLSH